MFVDGKVIALDDYRKLIVQAPTPRDSPRPRPRKASAPSSRRSSPRFEAASGRSRFGSRFKRPRSRSL